MAKYHISPSTGSPALCKAHVKACPVGGEHYGSKEEAQKAFEASQETLAASKRKTPDASGSLPGKTFLAPGLGQVSVDEYHEHLHAIHGKWKGKDGEVTQALAKELDLGDDFSNNYYDTFINMEKDRIVVGVSTPVGYGSLRDAEDVDVEAEADPRLQQHELYKEISFVEEGYYGEDSYLAYEYSIPSNQAEAVVGVLEANATTAAYARAKDPRLPKWAALPEEMNEEPGTRFKTDPSSYYQRAWSSKIGAYYSREPSANPSLSKYDNVINHTAKAAQLRKAAANTRKKLAALTDFMNKLADEETYPTGTVVEDETGQSFKLNKTVRSSQVLNASGRAASMENFVKSAEKRASLLDKVTPSDIKEAKKQKAEAIMQNKQDRQDWIIGKLSNYYPSTDAAKRTNEAAKWVKAHPETMEAKDLL